MNSKSNKQFPFVRENNNNESLLLKILVFIFYYEKKVVEQKNSFLIFGEYYLINANWINELKYNCDYKNLLEALNIIAQKYQKINYNNLDEYIDSIIKNFEDNNIFKFQNFSFSNNSMNTEIEYTTNKPYILHSTIMDLINTLTNQQYINIKSKKLVKIDNNNLILIDKYNNNIITGKINDDKQTLNSINIPIFTIKYIFIYKSIEIFNEEKELLLDKSNDSYINYRKCDKYESNRQILIQNKDNKELGYLFVLTDTNTININNINFNIIKKNNSTFGNNIPINVNNFDNIDNNVKNNLDSKEFCENKSLLKNKINELEYKIDMLKNENNELKQIISDKDNENIKLKNYKDDYL